MRSTKKYRKSSKFNKKKYRKSSKFNKKKYRKSNKKYRKSSKFNKKKYRKSRKFFGGSEKKEFPGFESVNGATSSEPEPGPAVITESAPVEEETLSRLSSPEPHVVSSSGPHVVSPSSSPGTNCNNPKFDVWAAGKSKLLDDLVTSEVERKKAYECFKNYTEKLKYLCELYDAAGAETSKHGCEKIRVMDDCNNKVLDTSEEKKTNLKACKWTEGSCERLVPEEISDMPSVTGEWGIAETGESSSPIYEKIGWKKAKKGKKNTCPGTTVEPVEGWCPPPNRPVAACKSPK